MKRTVFAVLSLIVLLACRQTIPFGTPDAVVDPSTATPTAELPTVTPTYENCFWTWAYGEGSPEFDAAVLEQLTAEGIQTTVTSTSYGEVYSCDNSYHAKDLDVNVEIRMADLQDQTLLTETAIRVYAILEEKIPISGISSLGNIVLTFFSDDGISQCIWHYVENICQ